ncbi:MAG: nuclear pore complex subunit [Bacteroidetes bacterium]|nr:nuclear pore complex subunit [Bacteroidota bacterium]MBS1231286.1 nuclear pore complex subunit [Bacteroidota bacterium]
MKELKNMFIEQSDKTPLVDLNYLSGELILSGKSIPINAPRIFEPILDWVNEYVKNPRQTTNLRLNLEYFNTASSIWLAKIVKSLTSINKPEYVLILHIYFSIEDFDDIDDIKDDLSPLIDVISNTTVSVGLKIYGTDESGKILKESMIFI